MEFYDSLTTSKMACMNVCVYVHETIWIDGGVELVYVWAEGETYLINVSNRKLFQFKHSSSRPSDLSWYIAIFCALKLII